MAEMYIKTQRIEQIYYVELHRPERRNALTFGMVKEIAETIAGVDKFPDIRAVIVSGYGSIFSSGVDVASLMEVRQNAGDQLPSRWVRRVANQLQHALHLIESTEVPIIGALHGQVIGLGFELALAFDLRVATPSCLLSLPEARLGLVADVGGTTRLSRIIGTGRAKELLMTGRSISAETAFHWGLINQLALNKDVVEQATELAKDIIQYSAPRAVALTKRIIDLGDGTDKFTQMALEAWAQSELITSEDVAEGVMAVANKRTAHFKGR